MPYYLKVQNRELGPFEERVVIAHLIDGEINSRSQIKEGINGTFHKIEDTPFNAVLPKLTARWRYNIGALKREHSFMLVSLLVTLVPLLNFLFGLYNPAWRSFLLNYKCMGAVFTLSVIGFLASCYFTWMFAYRCYRVVPKSQYNITPGWRIMLTFIPFFRLGWNYCMWCPFASKLRKLTNYSMNTGRAAAIFYSTNMIIMTVFIYLVIFFDWAHRILDLSFGQKPWQNLVGGIFVGILVLSFIFTVTSFVIMSFRLKNAALAILRHRYAYNIVGKKVDSPFMISVLQAQRKRGKARRWGHGLGIAGVLILWPLLFIGIPYLVLYIVGTVKLNNTAQMYENANIPYTQKEFDRNYGEKSASSNVNYLDDAEIDKISKSDLSSLDNNALEKYYKSLNETAESLTKKMEKDCIKQQIILNSLFSNNRAELMREHPGWYLYSWTPFCLISRADMGRKMLDCIKLVGHDFYLINATNLPHWQSSNVILNDLGYNKNNVIRIFERHGEKINKIHILCYKLACILKERNNGNFELPKYKDVLTGKDLFSEEVKK